MGVIDQPAVVAAVIAGAFGIAGTLIQLNMPLSFRLGRAKRLFELYEGVPKDTRLGIEAFTLGEIRATAFEEALRGLGFAIVDGAPVRDDSLEYFRVTALNVTGALVLASVATGGVPEPPRLAALMLVSIVAVAASTGLVLLLERHPKTDWNRLYQSRQARLARTEALRERLREIDARLSAERERRRAENGQDSRDDDVNAEERDRESEDRVVSQGDHSARETKGFTKSIGQA